MVGQRHERSPRRLVVLQDDGNLVVYDATGPALWASNTVEARRSGRVADFLPTTSAPRFANGPWPTGTKLSLSVMGLPPVSIDATAMGLCGAMSFLTRDIVESGTPQPRGRVASAVSVPVAQHLLSRLIDSFAGVGVVARWVQSTAGLDHDTVVTLDVRCAHAGQGDHDERDGRRGGGPGPWILPASLSAC